MVWGGGEVVVGGMGGSGGGRRRVVGGVPLHFFFIVCYCFRFWIGCVFSNSAIMKSDLFYSVLTF